MDGKWSEVENRSNIPSILWRQNSLHYCSIYQSTRLEETQVLPHLSPFHFLLHSPSHSLHSLPPYIRPKGPKPKLTPSLTYSTITRQVAFKALHQQWKYKKLHCIQTYQLDLNCTKRKASPAIAFKLHLKKHNLH